MNETEIICFICRDTCDILYKICDCKSSIICKDCYCINSTHTMNNCGICRTEYQFNYTRNNIEYLRLLFFYVFKYILLLVIELFPPCYLYSLEVVDKDYNSLFLASSFFCVIIVNVINYYLAINLYSEQMKIGIILYSIIKCVYLLIFLDILIYTKDDNTLYNYSYFGIGILYILPMILFGLLIIIKNIKKIFTMVSSKSFTRKIIIKSIIHNIDGIDGIDGNTILI